MQHPDKSDSVQHDLRYNSWHANWEFEEWYNNISFWCEMEPVLEKMLENAARKRARTYSLRTSKGTYTWDLINMTQYHNFLDHKKNPKQTERRIRRCYILHAPWTGDPRKHQDLWVPKPQLELGLNWSQPIWEFEEQYEGKQYWAEMDPKYVTQIKDAYNDKDLVEYEMCDENCWYEWHLDIMTQYRYFYNKWDFVRRSSRSIRKIIVEEHL